MKKKRNRILIILAAALVLGLLIWRLWPRTLESVSGLDFDRAVVVSAYTKTSAYEGGSLVSVSHHIDGDELSPTGQKQSNYLMTGLQTVKCRPSFSNLLRPWLISGFSRIEPANILYAFVSGEDSAVNLTMTDRGKLIVDNRLYYITNKWVFDTLWNHITNYDTKEVN